jgi:Flp pilus assembly protein TadG
MSIFRGSSTQSRPGDRRRHRGQSLVEFALVLPLFLLILAAIVDFGMALSSTITLSNAAREGARLGTVNPSPAAVEARVRAVATTLDGTRLTVTSTCRTPSGSSWVACSGAGWQQGDSMVVTANYNYQLIWPLAFGTNIPLSSSVEMRVE